VAASTAQWNGVGLITTYVNSTTLTATAPASDLAGSSTAQITVRNPAPGGGASSASPFVVNSPTPAITSISPQVVPPGTAATITITGTGFEANSVILWNGSPRPTTVVSTTVLTVNLTAADLQSPGTGALTVSNPGPSAATSPASPLSIFSQPVIQSVSISAVLTSPSSNCSQFQVTVTGTGFDGTTQIQANGTPLAFMLQNSPTAIGLLPSGFQSAVGGLSFTVSNFDEPNIVSSPYAYPASNPPLLAFCVTPSPATVYPNSTFSFNVQPSEINFSGSGTVTLGTLPTGITSAASSVAMPATGALLYLQAASSLAAGNLSIPFTAAIGSTTANGSFPMTVSTAAAASFNFSFASMLQDVLGVPIGGSASIGFSTYDGNSNADYDITPSLAGLPPGVTASFSPNPVPVGQNVTVTLTAANTAPVAQNAQITITGTSPVVPSSSMKFFADVTRPPGSLPGNRTDYIPTWGTPYQCAYDPTHNLIFCSNPNWNRIDVISNGTHQLVKRIPVLSPRGIDITPDNAKVWVQTASQNAFSIDTTSLHATRYIVPSGIGSSGLGPQFSFDRIFALADSTLFLYFDDSGDGGGGNAAVWNPQNNQLTVVSSGLVTGFGVPVKSGDGTCVYASYYSPYNTGMARYTTASKTLSIINQGTSYPSVMAVNHDGSRLLLMTFTDSLVGYQLSLYDSNLNSLGILPGSVSPFVGYGYFPGGAVFSPDNSRIYEAASYIGLNLLTLDSSSLAILGNAPSFSTVGYNTTIPFAVDSTGMVLGLQNYGLAWDDATFNQNYVLGMPTTSIVSALQTFAGPLAGGTTSSLYAFPALQPDVWFGQTRGTTSIASSQLEFISPPSTTAGPVNVKFIFPDGEQGFFPQLFSYSTFPQFALASGSSPDGGAPARVLGYGLPEDSSGGTVSVGGNAATITTTKGQYPPLSTEPIPSSVLNYTLPPGKPGPADLQITTPIGTGTLSNAIFYAKSVTDYGSTDSFTAVLLDSKRNQLYLTAGDHVDVFSLSSNQFLSPLKPQALQSAAQFTGLALTPDSSKLIVTDFADNSVSVINPDSPSSSFAIATPPQANVNQCTVGPLYAATTSTNKAFVSMGSIPSQNCAAGGNLYIVDLATKAVSLCNDPHCSSFVVGGIDATSDGNYAAFGSPICIFNAQANSYTVPTPSSSSSIFGSSGAAISNDANVAASGVSLVDSSPFALGSVAQPIALYQLPALLTSANAPLLHPRINASGSLYYTAYPNYLEIVDIPHGLLRMRFSLTQTVQNVPTPMSIDPSGRYIYLITDRGLTVIDLGQAPLAIGHLSSTTAAPGTQITVRGSGFDAGTTATLGGLAASVSFVDESTLTLTVPAAAVGPEDIVLTRTDGETFILENAIAVQ
jgi:IPT/TIG domain-containing protein